MKPLAPLLLLVVLTTAGCFGTAGKTSTSGSDSTSVASGTGGAGSSTGTGGHTGTATSTKGAGSPPVVSAFSATRPNATSLSFTFSFAATDADGDALTWSLDPRSNGTAVATGHTLPANATFAYLASGLYNATLTVTDGTTPVHKVLAVNATVAAKSVVVLTGKTTVSGNPAMCEPVPGTCSPGPALGAHACQGFNAGKNEQDCVFGALDAGYAGKPFTVSGKGDSMMVDFWDKCDAAAGKYVGGGTIGMALTGTVPAGAGCALLWNYGADPNGVALLALSVG